jgi:hypothetical protein
VLKLSKGTIIKKTIKKFKKAGASVTFLKGELDSLGNSYFMKTPIFTNFLLFFISLFQEDLTILKFNFLVFIIFCLLYIFLIKSVKIIEFRLPHIKRSERKGGKIKLGTILSNAPKKSFYLNENDMKKHVLISGLTGMGKSNLIKSMVTQINYYYPKIPFLLIEFKGEYKKFADLFHEIEVYKPGLDFTINIFDPQKENSEIYAEKLVNMLISCQVFSFQEEYSAQMENILIEIIKNVCSDPLRRNWEGFDYYSKKIQNIMHKKIPYINQTIVSIHNRLRRLKSGPLKPIFETQPKITLQEVIKNKLIIDLSSIIRLGGTKEDAVFFANILFNSIWVQNLKRGESKNIRHFTIIEDSQFFISQNSVRSQVRTNYLEDFALLLRGTGECLININTRPNISEDIMANAGVVISFQLSYDQKMMGRLLALREKNFYYLTKLKVGQCLIKVNSIPTPFLMQVPKIDDLLNNHKINPSKFLKIKKKSIRKFKELKKMESKNNVASQKNERSKLKSKKIHAKHFKTNNDGLNNKIEKSKGYNKAFKSKNLNLIPITKWSETLSNLENLNLINQVSFAYFECNRLFESVLKVFAKRWDLGDIKKKKYKNFLRNLKLLSPTLGNIIFRLLTLKSRLNKQNLPISDVEEFISLLKRIFMTIKIKNEKVHFNFAYIDRSNNNENQIKLSIDKKPLISDNRFPRSENDNQKFDEENLWKSLREALFRFEQKSQLRVLNKYLN